MPTGPGKVRVSVDVAPAQRAAWRAEADRLGLSLARYITAKLDGALDKGAPITHAESSIPTGARRPRKVECEHGIPPGVYCDVCDR